jgi:acyl carrier protein
MHEDRATFRQGDRAGDHSETKAKVADDVRSVLSDVLGVPLVEVVPQSELESDLGMDSLKMIETNVALEVKFGFVSPDVARPEELEIRTVDDLVGYVAGQILEQRDRQ